MTKLLAKTLELVAELPNVKQDQIAQAIQAILSKDEFVEDELQSQINELEKQFIELKENGLLNNDVDPAWRSRISTLVDKISHEENQLRKELFPNG